MKAISFNKKIFNPIVYFISTALRQWGRVALPFASVALLALPMLIDRYASGDEAK